MAETVSAAVAASVTASGIVSASATVAELSSTASPELALVAVCAGAVSTGAAAVMLAGGVPAVTTGCTSQAARARVIVAIAGIRRKDRMKGASQGRNSCMGRNLRPAAGASANHL